MPIIDVGSPRYQKPRPNFDLVSEAGSHVPESALLKIGEPYILTDSSRVKDEDESQLDQFSCMVLDKEALVDVCGPQTIELWDRAALLSDLTQEQLPGINIDHMFVKHLGIIMQEDSIDPCIAVEEENNVPETVALQQSILNAYGELLAAIVLGVAKRVFKMEGFEDLSTQIDMMAHILKRRNFPCFGTEKNAWYNNLTLHTSAEIQDLTRDRANFNGAVPLPALFMQGSGRVYFSRYAQVFEAEKYSVVLIGGAEQIVVSPSPPGQVRRMIALGRCEEDVFKHYAQYDPLNQMRDRMANELKPQ